MTSRSLGAASRVISDYAANAAAVRRILLEDADNLRAQDFTVDDRPAPQRPEGWDANDPENWPASGSDPTGEAAIAPNRARSLLGELDYAEGLAAAAARVFDRVLGETTHARGLERTELAKVARRNDEWCSACGNEAPCTAAPTTVNGNLKEARWLGRSCYDYVRTRGRLPSRQDLAALKRNGKWPKDRAA